MERKDADFMHDSSVGDRSMKFGTNDLHMTLIDNQPLATQNSNIFKMASQFEKWLQLDLRFGQYHFAWAVNL